MMAVAASGWCTKKTKGLPKSRIDILAWRVPFLAEPNPRVVQQDLTGLCHGDMMFGFELVLDKSRTDDVINVHTSDYTGTGCHRQPKDSW